MRPPSRPKSRPRTRSGWRNGCQNSPTRKRRSIHRVLWTCNTVDINNTIITHDAGSRDQLSPFWKAVEPLSTSAGADHAVGYGSGLHGRQAGKTRKTCINVWGDAAIGSPAWISETAVPSAFQSCRSC